MQCSVDGSIFVIHGWQAHKLAIEAGLRPTYNGVQGGWCADTKRLPDLVAWLSYRNVDVEIVDTTTVSGAPVPRHGVAGAPDQPAPTEPDLDLFGGAA